MFLMWPKVREHSDSRGFAVFTGYDRVVGAFRGKPKKLRKMPLIKLLIPKYKQRLKLKFKMSLPYTHFNC